MSSCKFAFTDCRQTHVGIMWGSCGGLSVLHRDAIFKECTRRIYNSFKNRALTLAFAAMLKLVQLKREQDDFNNRENTSAEQKVLRQLFGAWAAWAETEKMMKNALTLVSPTHTHPPALAYTHTHTHTHTRTHHLASHTYTHTVTHTHTHMASSGQRATVRAKC